MHIGFKEPFFFLYFFLEESHAPLSSEAQQNRLGCSHLRVAQHLEAQAPGAAKRLSREAGEWEPQPRRGIWCAPTQNGIVGGLG